MSVELTVVLKDAERTYRQKFLEYDQVSMIACDKTIERCIQEARTNFEGEPEDIQVKALLVVR